MMDKSKEYRENKAVKLLLSKLFSIEDNEDSSSIEKKRVA